MEVVELQETGRGTGVADIVVVVSAIGDDSHDSRKARSARAAESATDAVVGAERLPITQAEPVEAVVLVAKAGCELVGSCSFCKSVRYC